MDDEPPASAADGPENFEAALQRRARQFHGCDAEALVTALVALLRPRVAVAIGAPPLSHYLAICKGVFEYGLGTTCRAFLIGGDHDENQALQNVIAQHDQQYGHFASVLHHGWSDWHGDTDGKPVDLLQINDCPQEVAEQIWQQWKRRLGNRTIVLLSDICRTDGAGGPTALWRSLKDEFPSFEFNCGDGLGIIAVGSDIPHGLRAILQLASTHSASLPSVDHLAATWRDGAAEGGQIGSVTKPAGAADRLFARFAAENFALRSQMTIAFVEYAECLRKNREAYREAIRRNWQACLATVRKDRQACLEAYRRNAQEHVHRLRQLLGTRLWRFLQLAARARSAIQRRVSLGTDHTWQAMPPRLSLPPLPAQPIPDCPPPVATKWPRSQPSKVSAERKPTTMPGAIVCGMPHCGSTLLLDMLKAHPRVYARFEIGLLFARSLSYRELIACRPYVGWLRQNHGLVNRDFQYIAEAPDWPEAYRRLLEVCLRNERNPEIKKRDFLIDKTPMYSRIIDTVLARLPGVPVIGLIRDPRALYCSTKRRVLKRRGVLPIRFLDLFVIHYQRHMQPLLRAASHSPDILLVRYEELVRQPAVTLELICNHIGLSYTPSMQNPGNSFAIVTEDSRSLNTDKILQFRHEISQSEEVALRRALYHVNWTMYPIELCDGGDRVWQGPTSVYGRT